jgi:hypothetical protein
MRNFSVLQFFCTFAFEFELFGIMKNEAEQSRQLVSISLPIEVSSFSIFLFLS